MPNFESQVHGRGDGDFCKATKLLYVKVGFIQVFLFKILIVAQKVYIFKGYFLEKKILKLSQPTSMLQQLTLQPIDDDPLWHRETTNM